MTKPIEWTETIREDVNKNVRLISIRTWTDKYGTPHRADDPPSPSDLSAALAAMGEGEREEVLRASGAAASFDMQTAIITDLRTRLKEATCLHSEAESSLDLERTLRRADARFADAKLNESIARAEDAERERDRMAREFGTRPGELPDDGEIARVVRERAEFRDRAEKAERERDTERACRLENEAELHRANKELGDLRTRLIAALKAERDDARLRCGAALATAATATARADTAAASHLASAGLVAEFRGRLAAAESALDVAQSRAVRAEKLADEALADRDRARASLDIVRHDLRGTRAEVDALRSRLIAAETTAAQREPREYPLAEGSRWEGDEIVDLDGTRTSAVGCTGGSHIWCVGPWGEKRFPRLADVLALAHRRGLL